MAYAMQAKTKKKRAGFTKIVCLVDYVVNSLIYSAYSALKHLGWKSMMSSCQSFDTKINSHCVDWSYTKQDVMKMVIQHYFNLKYRLAMFK